MSDRKIVIGSVVRLKSGGPRMTVVEINDLTATCNWFAVSCDDKRWVGHELKSGMFDIRCLDSSMVNID